MLLQELHLNESDKIANLETGKDLFNQKFVYFGDYNEAAKKIIADKLKNRWAVLVQSLTTGDQGVTDRHYSTYVDLGPNGHGFSDLRAAQAFLRARKKEIKQKNNSDSKRQVHEEYAMCRTEDIDTTLKKLKPLLGDAKLPGHIGLSYAKY